MSDHFEFHYELHEHGWATAQIVDGELDIGMTASYLQDSLRDLANAVFAISRGAADRRVCFLDEPGEHQFRLTRESGPECHYSVRWFDDWDSWGMRRRPGSKVVAEGTVPVRRLVQQVYSALWRLHEQYGEVGYKERWVQHDFPRLEMDRLVGSRDW